MAYADVTATPISKTERVIVYTRDDVSYQRPPNNDGPVVLHGPSSANPALVHYLDNDL